MRENNGSSLKTIATVGGVVLTSVALLACVAVVLLTSLMNRATIRLDAAANRVRAVESLRTALLAYGRESDLDFLEHGGGSARRAAEAQVFAGLQNAHQFARNPTDTPLIDQADENIHRYLDARRRAEAQNTELRDVILSAKIPLEQALHTLDQLAENVLAAAASARESAKRWDAFGNIVGTAVGAALLLGLVVTILGLKRIVISPLLRLSDDIDRFAVAGEQRGLLPVTGLAEFRTLTRAFNALADRLAAREAARQQFLAGVAHDLRNPIAALHTRVQLLEALGNNASDEELRKAVKLLGRQLTRLNGMVSDFLDASQIEAGQLKLRLERCDVRSAAVEAVQLYQASANDYTVDLSVPDAPVIVTCDAARLGQVLNNLLSNAIKYSPKSSEIFVGVTVERDEAVLSVRDRGPGIAAADIAHIFEPFRRSTAARDVVPGAGLGLAVVRKIVEAHGGRIEVDSAPGVGSTFKVRLPMRVAEPAHSEDPTSLRC